MFQFASTKTACNLLPRRLLGHLQGDSTNEDNVQLFIDRRRRKFRWETDVGRFNEINLLPTWLLHILQLQVSFRRATVLPSSRGRKKTGSTNREIFLQSATKIYLCVTTSLQTSSKLKIKIKDFLFFNFSVEAVVVACGSKIHIEIRTKSGNVCIVRAVQKFVAVSPWQRSRICANCSPLRGEKRRQNAGEMQIRNAPRTISSSQMLARNTRRVIVRIAKTLHTDLLLDPPLRSLQISILFYNSTETFPLE